MRMLILITLLFKVQINIASEVGNLNPTCWNGKGCLSDSHCGENGICKFSPMTLPGKPLQSSTSPGQQPVKSGEGICFCGNAEAYDMESGYGIDSDFGMDYDEDFEMYSDEYYDDLYNPEDSYEKSIISNLISLNLKTNLPDLPSLLGRQLRQKPKPCKQNKRCWFHRNCGPKGAMGRCMKRRKCGKGVPGVFFNGWCCCNKVSKCKKDQKCWKKPFGFCGRNGQCLFIPKGEKCPEVKSTIERNDPFNGTSMNPNPFLQFDEKSQMNLYEVNASNPLVRQTIGDQLICCCLKNQ